MATFLSPAVALMERLTYPKKLILVAILFLFPLSITTFMVIKRTSDNIHVARTEQVGLSYIRPLRNLQQHLAEHRFLASVVITKKTGNDELAAKNLDIGKDIDIIDKTTLETQETLGAKEQWEMLKAAWGKIKTADNMTAEQSKKGHDELIHGVINLYGHISAVSGLLQDSSLDNIYLVQALTNDIPQASERGGQVRYYGMTFLTATRAITFEEKAGMLIDFDGSTNALEATKHDIAEVLKVRPDLAEELNKPLEAGIKNNAELLETVKKEILDENWNITPDEFKAMSSKAISSYFTLFDATSHALEQLLNHSLAQEQHKRLLILGVVVVSLAVVLYFFIGFYRSSMQSINQLMSSSKQISEGDLCTRITHIAGDELGTVASAFNEMAEKFRTVIQQMAHTSTHLASASEELSCVTRDNTNGVQEQQNQFTQVAAAITEMSATVQEVAGNAAEAAASAEKADKNVTEGQQVIHCAIKAINELTAQVSTATTVIQNLEKESENIGGVLNIINGIAEQTNLLALNAAIEAARAGEQGRGFAVVADEVRTLAQRTKNSTQEIQQMIAKFHSGTSEAVKVMEQSSHQSHDSMTFAEKAGAIFTDITREVGKITSMNQQIATAAEEQSSVASEIDRNIHKVTAIVEQVAAGTGQIAASSDALAKLAVASQASVARFKV